MAIERFIEETKFVIDGKEVKIVSSDCFDPEAYRHMLGLDGGVQVKLSVKQKNHIASRLYRNNCLSAEEIAKIGGRLTKSSQ